MKIALVVAGTVFGEVGVSLFVAGAAFRAFLGDVAFFHKNCVSKMGRPSKVSQAAGAR